MSSSHSNMSAGEGNSGSKLNPDAMQFPLEEDRSLYLTFSNGFPLTESQIFWFFNTNFGECVERVYVHRLRNQPVKHGMIVLRSPFFPSHILHGEEEARFSILGRSMRCKRFRPRSSDGSRA